MSLSSANTTSPYTHAPGLASWSSSNNCQDENWLSLPTLNIPQVTVRAADNDVGLELSDDASLPLTPLVTRRALSLLENQHACASPIKPIGLGFFLDDERCVSLPTFPDWSSPQHAGALADLEDSLNSMYIDESLDDTFASIRNPHTADTTLYFPTSGDATLDNIASKLASMAVDPTFAQIDNTANHQFSFDCTMNVDALLPTGHTIPCTPMRQPTHDLPGTPYPKLLADIDTPVAPWHTHEPSLLSSIDIGTVAHRGPPRSTLVYPAAPRLPSMPFSSRNMLVDAANESEASPVVHGARWPSVAFDPPPTPRLPSGPFPVASRSAGAMSPPAAPSKKRHRREMSEAVLSAGIPERCALGIVHLNATAPKARSIKGKDGKSRTAAKLGAKVGDLLKMKSVLKAKKTKEDKENVERPMKKVRHTGATPA